MFTNTLSLHMGLYWASASTRRSWLRGICFLPTRRVPDMHSTSGSRRVDTTFSLLLQVSWVASVFRPCCSLLQCFPLSRFQWTPEYPMTTMIIIRLMRRSRLLGSRNFRVRFFRVPSSERSSELGSRNSEIYWNSRKQIKCRNLTFSYKLTSI